MNKIIKSILSIIGFVFLMVIIYLIVEFVFFSLPNAQSCEGLGTKEVPMKCSYVFKFWKPDEIKIYNEERDVLKIYNEETGELIRKEQN